MKSVRHNERILRYPKPLCLDRIYTSLEGEGPYTGTPTIFVRLHGCNQNCVWCDTVQTDERQESTSASVYEICSQYKSISRMSITGGEPLLQEGIWELAVMWLREQKLHQVNIETNGTIEIPEHVDRRIHLSIDYKCEHAGLGTVNVYQPAIANRIQRLVPLKWNFIYKAVVRNKQDVEEFYDWIQHTYKGVKAPMPLYVSPLFGAIGLSELADIVLKAPIPLRMSIQTHKIIWDPMRKDV